MSFITGALGAVNDYLNDIALQTFNITNFVYEPSLTFGRQLREQIALFSGDFAKKNKNKKWLIVGYARDPVRYTLKRTEVYYEQVAGLYSSKWKRREVDCVFKYVFISPSPELLELVEEKVVVEDFGFTLFPTVDVNVYNKETKSIEYTYPFEYLVNVEKFEIQNFSHLDDINEGVFSIFSMNAKVNFSVFTVNEVYDSSDMLCEKIVLTININGDEKDVEIT